MIMVSMFNSLNSSSNVLKIIHKFASKLHINLPGTDACDIFLVHCN